MTADLPLLIEADELEAMLGTPGLLIVDLSDPEKYRQKHIPGAVHLAYSRLNRQQPPAMGLLPAVADLSALLSELGLRADTHVVAYDSEGGGRASRLLWTLDVVGHQGYSLLNGGARAWFEEGHPAETQANTPSPSDYSVADVDGAAALADKAWLMSNLERRDVAILDARTPAEFSGEDVRAARGGHIPGAANLNWTDTLDPDNNNRFRPAGELLRMLQERGITPDREVITHCQTHHRSALTWVVLKLLGFERARGYPGSWSEWGNAEDTPVERG
ncbi:MAG: sulfurtransferase [Aquisalimonadaceae bacterium]